jgi:taurine transport system permease protein
LPDILVGLRIGMGLGWTTLVAAEMIAADAGLGKMVANASNFLRTDVVVLGILVIDRLGWGAPNFGRRASSSKFPMVCCAAG